jgi:hypothetical protein
VASYSSNLQINQRPVFSETRWLTGKNRREFEYGNREDDKKMGRRRQPETERAPGRAANRSGGAKTDHHLHLLQLRSRMLRSRGSKLIHLLEVRRDERDYLTPTNDHGRAERG